MTREILKANIEKALLELHHHDNHLLKNDGSERSIAHCLANHLQKIYADYHADCEYNVNVDAANRRKEIILPADEILRFRRSETNRNSIEVDDEIYYSVSVYPDIIVHKRGRNNQNLIIFELKKSSSTVSYDYDKLKLCKYTGVFERSLRYRFGVFIDIATKTTDNYKFKFKIFENGEEEEEYQIP